MNCMKKWGVRFFVFGIVHALVLLWSVSCVKKVGAQYDKTALHIAQCLRAEADTYKPDYAPIAHILRKRAKLRGVHIDAMTMSYCSVFDKRSPKYYVARSRNIRQSTFKKPKHGTVAEWRELQTFVESFLRGEVKDPCPSAIHWGGKTDVPWEGLVEVCKWLGKRGNKVYRLGGLK